MNNLLLGRLLKGLHCAALKLAWELAKRDLGGSWRDFLGARLRAIVDKCRLAAGYGANELVVGIDFVVVSFFVV